MLSGETVFPKRLLFQDTKSLSNIDKLKTLVAPKMTDLITFLENNEKSAIYIGGDINEIYRYLEMIGAPTTLTNLGQRSHHFRPSSSINNYK